MITGFNTNLRHAERVFHIQSEHSDRDGSLLETLVFVDGEILARTAVRASEQDSGDEPSLQRALEKQHWDLVLQIRHGLLDEEPRPDPPVRSSDRSGIEILQRLEDRVLEVTYTAAPGETQPVQQRIDSIKNALFEPVDLNQWREACAKRMALVFRW